MKNTPTVVTILLAVLSIMVIVLALRWMILDQPWLLDKKANEVNLGLGTTGGNMSFDQWFAQMENPTGARKYLNSIYRFFGTWMLGMGLSWLVLLYFGRSNRRLLSATIAVMGLMLGIALIFEYRYIWVSIYVPLSFGLGFLWIAALALHVWNPGGGEA